MSIRNQMSVTEARALAIEQGVRIKHVSFLGGGYVYYRAGVFYTDEGTPFRFPKDYYFQFGWTIFEL